MVITGATSGIGRATALALGRLGAELILVSRDQCAGNTLIHRIGKSSTGANTLFIPTDLSEIKQVRAAANQIRAHWNRVDVLINNAGARFDTYAATSEGFECTFATNHLGHFLLTNLLVDRLNTAPAGRVITVSSSAAMQAINDDHRQYEASNYDRRQAYAKSKLANLLFAFELARRLKGNSTASLAVDPGVVATRFARNNGLLPWLKHLFYHGRRRELSSASTGADTLIYLASTPTLPAEASGKYFKDRQPITACPAACDLVAATELWQLSESLVGLVVPKLVCWGQGGIPDELTRKNS